MALNRGNTAHTVRVYTGELAFGELLPVGPVPAEPVSVVNGVFTVTLLPLSQQIYQCAEKHTCGEYADGLSEHVTAENIKVLPCISIKLIAVNKIRYSVKRGVNIKNRLLISKRS